MKRQTAVTVSQNRFHARQAAVALLKMAKTTSDPKVVAGLIEAAADLKEQAGELPPPISIKPPTYRPILLALQLGKNRRTVESSPQAEMREQSVRDVLVPPLGTGVFSYAAAPPRQGVKPIRRNDVEAMGPAQKMPKDEFDGRVSSGHRRVC